MASDVEIGWRTQISSEVRPWAIDLTQELDDGDVPAFVSSTLTDLMDGSDYSTGLASAPVLVVSPVRTVTQVVSQLVPGHRYRLVLTVIMVASKQTNTVLNLYCPF